MEEAIERVMAGPERKSRVISPREKKIVSIHESGHTLLSLLLPNVDPLHKVSIMPRGIGSLGYTLQLPLQDRYILSEKELFARIMVLLGGRIAEKLLLGEITTGAGNDLEVATKMARRMVMDYGMSQRLSNVTLGRKEGPVFLGRDLIEQKNYSEHTAKVIDDEVKAIVDKAYSQAEKNLAENIDKLKKLSDVLLEREVMTAEDVKKLLGLNSGGEKESEGSSKG